MYIVRQTLRAAADLAATVLWTGPAIQALGCVQLVLNIKATNANPPVTFAWEVSDDGTNWLTGAPPVGTLTQYDAIAGQALNNAGGRIVALICNYQGGATPGLPWKYARPKITGHATLTISGLEVGLSLMYLRNPVLVEAGLQARVTQ